MTQTVLDFVDTEAEDAVSVDDESDENYSEISAGQTSRAVVYADSSFSQTCTVGSYNHPNVAAAEMPDLYHSSGMLPVDGVTGDALVPDPSFVTEDEVNVWSLANTRATAAPVAKAAPPTCVSRACATRRPTPCAALPWAAA